jgi:penicillin-binding protein 1A
MTVFVYLAVFVITAGSVLFGLDWQSAPMSAMLENAGAVQAVSVPAPVLPPPPPRTGGPDDTPVEPAPVAQTPAAPAAPENCHVDACTKAYHTFRASDCTFMAIGGQRRLCTK